MPTDTTPDASALASFLAQRPPIPALAGLAEDELVPMREKGVAHAHFRLPGRGLVLRVPRLSQWALPAADNLAYQAECFRRAAPSRATPRLVAVLPVSPVLPRGALLVEDIAGRPPRLPDDLPALATALARLHALPAPPPGARPPLLDHGAEGPVAGTLAVIERQAPALEAASLPAATRAALDEELAWARRFAVEAAAADHPITLVGTDTHPGNFLLRPTGEAVLVDLEKALYGSPAIDLAHATLITSTRWDLDVEATLGIAEVRAFYTTYLSLAGPHRAARLRPWLGPMRRLTWLRTMMWCVRWRVAAAITEDWSKARVDPALLAHIESRIAALFAPPLVAWARAEWLTNRGPDLCS